MNHLDHVQKREDRDVNRRLNIDLEAQAIPGNGREVKPGPSQDVIPVQDLGVEDREAILNLKYRAQGPEVLDRAVAAELQVTKNVVDSSLSLTENAFGNYTETGRSKPRNVEPRLKK